MKDIKFTKKVNVEVLHKELVAAGFKIYGVTYNSGTNECIVHLYDEETKQG